MTPFYNRSNLSTTSFGNQPCCFSNLISPLSSHRHPLFPSVPGTQQTCSHYVSLLFSSDLCMMDSFPSPQALLKCHSLRSTFTYSQSKSMIQVQPFFAPWLNRTPILSSLEREPIRAGTCLHCSVHHYVPGLTLVQSVLESDIWWTNEYEKAVQ